MRNDKEIIEICFRREILTNQLRLITTSYLLKEASNIQLIWASRKLEVKIPFTVV